MKSWIVSGNYIPPHTCVNEALMNIDHEPLACMPHDGKPPLMACNVHTLIGYQNTDTQAITVPFQTV
jgi:hypothetical protein